jgi:hypothetical protein
MQEGKKRNEKEIWNDHETLLLMPIPNYLMHFHPYLSSFVFFVFFVFLILVFSTHNEEMSHTKIFF